MGLVANKQVENFSYKDYQSWDDGRRWEIINGQAYDMTPAPGTTHQLMVTELLYYLRSQLEGTECKVFTAPFDVRLPKEAKKEEDIKNIVQPDISVVCDTKKLDDKGCLGAPDLVIEILSPSSYRTDRMEKFNLYEEEGVNEYWLVSPAERMVEVFVPGEKGKFGRPTTYNETSVIHLQAINEISIDLKKVFSTLK